MSIVTRRRKDIEHIDDTVTQSEDKYRGKRRNCTIPLLILAAIFVALCFVPSSSSLFNMEPTFLFSTFRSISYHRFHKQSTPTSLSELYETPTTELSDDFRYKIGVAISITDEKDPRYYDLAGILAQSVYNMSQSSKYSFELIAMLQPHHRTIVKKLKAFGYKIIRKVSPIEVKDISEGRYKTKVANSGCCGLSEFMKLHAFKIKGYHRVIHLDSDVIIAGNIDKLLDLPDHLALLYTNSTLKGESLSGGVLIVKPSDEIFDQVLEIVKEGDFRYDGSGWRGSGVGYSWGGETIQGVLPYYFEIVKNNTISKRLNRCIYNSQGSIECMNTPIEDIKIHHMTACQKPFECRAMRQKRTCAAAHDLWWEMRHQLEDRMGLQITPRCEKGKTGAPTTYVPIDLNKRI